MLLGRAFAGSRGFARLAEIVKEAYAQVGVRPDPVLFLQGIPALYTEEGFARLAAEALAAAVRRARKLEEEAVRAAEEAAPLIGEGIMNAKHAAFCEERAAFARAVTGAPDLFAAARAVKEAQLSSKPPNTKVKASGRADALALDARMAAWKEQTDALREELAGMEEEPLLRESFFASGRIACALSSLLVDFGSAYARRKRRAGVLDFSDLEHKCLALLRIPEVREEVRSKYTHVFVDEYQDINPAQAEILSLVSGENVFMVGDAKQSIYGFRGCSAAFFARRYAALKGTGHALELNGNFRSADAVLEGVNRIFSAVMTEETCSVDYAATSVMRAGGAYPAGAGRVRFDLLPEKEAKEKETPDVYSVAAHLEGEGEEDREGRAIAAIIAEELTKKRYDVSLGEYVKIDFKDIAVLTRGKTAKAERIIGELVRRGVPVATAAEYNICDYPEVKAMIAILSYLDNAAQDIPLAAALKSSLGGVSDAELAEIRLFASPLAAKGADGKRTEVPFFAACEEYARRGTGALAEKLRAFYARAERYRLLSCVKGAAEIVMAILSETDMQIALLALPCGAERLARVLRLAAEAGTLTVAEFLAKLKAGGYKVGYAESGGENAVRVMTMHASKGLEFPVVIVAGMNDRFSDEDRKGDILYDEEWGFAPAAYDFSLRKKKETLLRRVVRARLLKKRSEDEMRLLYVAATRAEYSLHFVFSEKKQFDLFRVPEAGCFADFIDFDRCEEYGEGGEGGQLPAFSARTLVLAAPDGEAKREIEKRYRAPYAHEEALALPVKTSASRILRENEGMPLDHSFPLAEEQLPPADAAVGTAYHAFLERADLFASHGEEAARVLGVLGREDAPLASLLDPEKAASVLAMPVFGMLEGYDLWREREFLLQVPAAEIFGTACTDGVLVQGVIDLMAVKGEDCVIVDYKYSSHDLARLQREYLPQLRVYAAAARRAPGVARVRAFLVNILREEWVQVL